MEFDTLEQIVLAKTYERMGKYFGQVLSDNGKAKTLLGCSGLSEFYAKYEDRLKPFSYNGTWKNEDPQFDPAGTFFSICTDIEHDRVALGRFLKKFFSEVKKIDADDFAYISKNLNVIGYTLNELYTTSQRPKFKKMESAFDEIEVPKISGYELVAMTDGALERSDDVSSLLQKLHAIDPQLSQTYKSAVDAYSNGDYKTCASNCRNLLEDVLTKKCPGDRYAAILSLTKENIVDNNDNALTSKTKIFKYWIDNPTCDGDRFRLISMLYSFLSGIGTHSSTAIERKDALLALRNAEDVLIWIMY